MTPDRSHVARHLADYALGLRPDGIPSATVETVQRCVLDALAAAAAGASSAAATAARQCAERLGAGGAATLWFAAAARHPATAAFANSAAVSALDLDDGHRAAGGHPGAAVIPAVLALAQSIGAGWPETLAALTVGYEVGVRVAAARDVGRLDTLSTGRWCAYGVAAAAARLLRLTAAQAAEALATAGVLSPGLSAAGYSRVMGNHAKEGIPWATLTGMWAAELAAGGFTGPVDILDHPSYYVAPAITAGLGQGFAVDRVYFKPYACCRWAHAALDALRGLMRAQGLPAGEIAGIEVHTFERALRLNNYPDPPTLEAAQYSLPFCLAAAAVAGPEALLPLAPALLGRADIVAVARRVSLHVDPDLDRDFPGEAAARVVLVTAAGRHEALCRHPLGDPDNPMRWEELVGKFRTLTRGLLPAARAEAIIAAVRRLPEEGLTPLLDLLSENLMADRS
jgi:2-methylcitrate dehydratase PrpD